MQCKLHLEVVCLQYVADGQREVLLEEDLSFLGMVTSLLFTSTR